MNLFLIFWFRLFIKWWCCVQCVSPPPKKKKNSLLYYDDDDSIFPFFFCFVLFCFFLTLAFHHDSFSPWWISSGFFVCFFSGKNLHFIQFFGWQITKRRKTATKKTEKIVRRQLSILFFFFCVWILLLNSLNLFLCFDEEGGGEADYRSVSFFPVLPCVTIVVSHFICVSSLPIIVKRFDGEISCLFFPFFSFSLFWTLGSSNNEMIFIKAYSV